MKSSQGHGASTRTKLVLSRMATAEWRRRFSVVKLFFPSPKTGRINLKTIKFKPKKLPSTSSLLVFVVFGCRLRMRRLPLSVVDVA